MALRDRVKERIETDLSVGELDSLIAEAQSAIRDRWGPDRGDEPITVSLKGGGRIIDLSRPADVEEDVVVTEYSTYTDFIIGGEGTVLEVEDYSIRNGGRTLDRVSCRWGSTVELAYTPVDDQAQRDEVAIKLVKLSIEYAAASKVTVGDVSTDHVDYEAEREKLLGSLSPRKGLLLA